MRKEGLKKTVVIWASSNCCPCFFLFFFIYLETLTFSDFQCKTAVSNWNSWPTKFSAGWLEIRNNLKNLNQSFPPTWPEIPNLFEWTVSALTSHQQLQKLEPFPQPASNAFPFLTEHFTAFPNKRQNQKKMSRKFQVNIFVRNAVHQQCNNNPNLYTVLIMMMMMMMIFDVIL